MITLNLSEVEAYALAAILKDSDIPRLLRKGRSTSPLQYSLEKESSAELVEVLRAVVDDAILEADATSCGHGEICQGHSF